MFLVVGWSLAGTGVTAGSRSAPGIHVGNYHAPLATFALNDLQEAHARQPSLEPVGRGHHVAVRFGVVGHRIDAEHAAHFVHDVALLAVHHRERVAARVFALFG